MTTDIPALIAEMRKEAKFIRTVIGGDKVAADRWADALEAEHARADERKAQADKWKEIAERDGTALAQATDRIAELKTALEAFRKAKEWVAADSYDGIDARGRTLLEEADTQARAVLEKAE